MKKFKFSLLTSATTLVMAIPAIAHADPFHGNGGFLSGIFNFFPHGQGGAICGAPAPSVAAGVSSLVILGGAFMTSKFVKRARGQDAG